FDNLGGSIPGNANPFKVYFKDQPCRRWSSTGVTEETQNWQMDISGFGGPVQFKLVVDVSTKYPYPPQERFDNAPEPVQIDAIVGPGLSSYGGSAEVVVTLLDWQGKNGIGGIRVESPDLFDDTVDLTYSTPGPNPDEYVYAGIIENSLLAPAGDYLLLIATWDQNTDVYLYSECEFVISDSCVSTFHVNTLSTPSEREVIEGVTDFDWMHASITNESISFEDILITDITVLDVLDGVIGDMADINNAELWADFDDNGSYESRITATYDPIGGGGLSDTHTFVLNQTMRIPKDNTVNFVLLGDLSTGANEGGIHTMKVNGITVHGADTGNVIYGSYVGAGQTITINTSGDIFTSLSASSPESALVVAGNVYANLGAFDLIASNESFTVDTLTFDMTAGYDSMQTVKITYPTKTGTDSRETSVSAAAIAFSNLTMYVPKNGRATVTVSGTTKRIGAGGSYGDEIIVRLDTSAASEFNAVGEASGRAKTGSDVSDQTASSMYLYNTVPTVVPDNPGSVGTIIPGGDVDLYKLRITADAAGSVGIKKLTFMIFITDSSTTDPSDADLSQFTFLRNGQDITNSAQISTISQDGGYNYLPVPIGLESINYVENNIPTWVQVIFDDSPANGGEQLISAGETVRYTLRARCGTGFATSDGISTSMLGDHTPAIAANYLSDVDLNAGDIQQVIALQNSEGTQDITDVEFIWSDISFIPHSSAFDDDGVLLVSSPDWTNGHLVNNFPLPAYGLTL
ncbi:hypothetical protein KKE14_01960, partial [Patescibacteria group bacterium]|nr:hypothetical protein [Patescibacteria group bacterium]